MGTINIINERGDANTMYTTQPMASGGMIAVWAKKPQDARMLMQQYLGLKRLPNGFSLRRKSFLTK